jgi:ribosomal protein S7
MNMVQQKARTTPVFKKAVDNVAVPRVKSRRVGGSSYQVPVGEPARRTSPCAGDRLRPQSPERGMVQKLANEIRTPPTSGAEP